MRRVLVIAFYTAPSADVGARRTDRFLCYLPRFGWEAIVLSVKTKYYTRHDASKCLPNNVFVARTLCPMPLVWYHNRKHKSRSTKERVLQEREDVSFSPSPSSMKRFSLRAKIAWSLQLPDEFNCWIPFGIWEGWRLIRRFHPEVIYASAKPISALVIGWALKKITGLPLVIDFRDIWIGNPWDIPQPYHVQRWKTRIERRLVCDAECVVLNTPKAREIYVQRYSDIPEDRFDCIPNGYDPADFDSIEDVARTEGGIGSAFTIVHTGTVYGLMDPRPLLRAIHDLLCSHSVAHNKLRLDFYGACLVRAGGRNLEDLVSELNLQGVVRLNPPVSHAEALRIQRTADALLLLIPGSDVAVPSKAYEYLKTGKPILALCSSSSATARLISETRTGVIADPWDVEAIKSTVLSLVSGALSINPDEEAIRRYSAEYQTRQLSLLLESVASQRAPK
ncbi:MAG: glycosyltransferase [Candidatus Caldarchaeum sp.]